MGSLVTRDKSEKDIEKRTNFKIKLSTFLCGDRDRLVRIKERHMRFWGTGNEERRMEKVSLVGGGEGSSEKIVIMRPRQGVLALS